MCWRCRWTAVVAAGVAAPAGDWLAGLTDAASVADVVAADAFDAAAAAAGDGDVAAADDVDAAAVAALLAVAQRERVRVGCAAIGRCSQSGYS